MQVCIIYSTILIAAWIKLASGNKKVRGLVSGLLRASALEFRKCRRYSTFPNRPTCKNSETARTPVWLSWWLCLSCIGEWIILYRNWILYNCACLTMSLVSRSFFITHWNSHDCTCLTVPLVRTSYFIANWILYNCVCLFVSFECRSYFIATLILHFCACLTVPLVRRSYFITNWILHDCACGTVHV